MTGKTCLKSPPNTKTFPPKGLSTQVILRKVLSTASKVNLCSIGASSQMKNLAALIKRASLLLREMLQVESSCNFRRILKREWAVLPPSIKSAEIPEETTAKVISPQDLTVASKILYKKVLPGRRAGW
ncbi:hypothetical protein RhiirC2_803801 [Rhizophagus irregularis]|uniref:Uncharacterized protein n=1 Tax=Rhizophagus irregularis TaxID=588596 RepID=A0A2N1LAH4_9GLOM|nr:hypothetical protein RhiirC2_803801 [Rhizophagus irregularis]